MTDLKKLLFALAAVLTGGVLYVGLNWIPLAGPLAVGFMVGYLVKDKPGWGFKAGIYSGVVGVLLLAYVLGQSGLLSGVDATPLLVLLTGWILLIWNLAAILLCGVGGLLGSLAGQTRRMIDAITKGFMNFPFKMSFGFPMQMQKPRKVINLRAPPVEHTMPQDNGETMKFTLCPHCGISNPEGSEKCGNCGKQL